MAGSMDADQFRAALERLGLTQTGANGVNTFLDVSERTSRRWAVDGPPDAVAMLLRLMISKKLTPAHVRKHYGRVADSRVDVFALRKD